MNELHPIDLLARHLRVDGLPEAEIRVETCFVTGRRVPCLPREYAISKEYTDMRFCAAPLSSWVGVDVVHAWKAGSHIDGKKRIFCPERQSCWYVDEQEFRMLRRDDIRRLVLDGAPRTPWAGWVTEKYRKHGSVRTQINYGPHGVWGFDERRVDGSNRCMVQDLYDRLRRYSDAGINRNCLMYPENMQPSQIMRIGIDVYSEFMRWSSSIKYSALYRFIVTFLLGRHE